jgi:hypothetical protein
MNINCSTRLYLGFRIKEIVVKIEYYLLIFFFRDKKQPTKSIFYTGEKKLVETEKERWINCKNCGQHITNRNQRIKIEGAHKHAFANPSGIVFEIGCYSNAIMVQKVGEPTNNFTWFPGFLWEIVICKRCSQHLGWYFSRIPLDGFWGLITDSIREC